MNIYKELRQKYSTSPNSKKPLTQEELSVRFNEMGYPITRESIGQLETDRIKDVTPAVKCAYADFFGISVDILNTIHKPISEKQRIKVQQVTGLSRNAIQCLELFREQDILKEDLEGLNALLEAYWEKYTEHQTGTIIHKTITIKSKDSEPKKIKIDRKQETAIPFSIFRMITEYLNISKPKLYDQITARKTDCNSFCFFNSFGDDNRPRQANIEMSLEALYKFNIIKQLEEIKEEKDAKRITKRKKEGD